LIRTLIAERTDPVLFGLSYDYVGDLSETVALLWPGQGGEVEAPTLAEVVLTPIPRASSTSAAGSPPGSTGSTRRALGPCSN